MDVKHKAWIALVMFAGLVGACSDEDAVDAKTAQAAMRALVSSVDTTMVGYHGKGDSSGTVTIKCEGGGSADVQGHVQVAVDPVTVDVQLAIAYNKCETQDGAAMSGSIDFRQSVLAGRAPVRVQSEYQGNVVFSGKLQAECAVDVMVLVDEAGKTVKVSGTFCGNDAADLDVEIMPHWED